MGGGITPLGANAKPPVCGFFILSAELEQPLKRYPYFPQPENMDAILSHPTPGAHLSERDKCNAPAPRGAGALKLSRSAESIAGVG